MFLRTCGVKMNGLQLWLVIAAVHSFFLNVNCGYHRRSMPTQPQTMSLSKNGWRPVLGSGLVYNGFGTAPLHAPSYKVPVVEPYPSSSRPVATRDANKLTSIAQSYRPTTIRTASNQSPTPSNQIQINYQQPAYHNQPINTYHNQYALPNNGYYKLIQNFPAENILIRNPHNPYSARPVYKYPTKIKPPVHGGGVHQYQNNQNVQYQNNQNVQYGHHQTSKPLDVFAKPIESYARPVEAKKPQQPISGSEYFKPEAYKPEVYKPEVFKLPEIDTAIQAGHQHVKTAQQQGLPATPKIPTSYPQYTYSDPVLPPSILGSFGSFGAQSVKGRDPASYQYPTKTTHSQPTKTTIFNSFSFSPNFKTSQYYTTTPKLQTTANHILYGSTLIDYKKANAVTEQSKLSTPIKAEGHKNQFKASPQDPFINYKVSTYNPLNQGTTSSYYNDYNAQSNYNKKKQMIHDNQNAGVNQKHNHSHKQHHIQSQVEGTPQSVQYKPTYEVTELSETDDASSHSSPSAWTTSNYNNKNAPDSLKQESHDTAFGKPSTPILSEEYAIVTEGDKGYENSLTYDSQVESQSRRPVGDDFEPIGKHKLKDYYYKVSTPPQEHGRRTKKPFETSRYTTESATHLSSVTNNVPLDTLPTLAPSQHFKRPNSQESGEKDKMRKRIKNRRRRPPLTNINRDETSTHKPSTVTEASVTTASVTTDLTTSVVPTVSPTSPTIVKKKLGHRRHSTTLAPIETTTLFLKEYDSNKESPIMKIASRPQTTKQTPSSSYDFRTSEKPDFTHKQDEKDTPTSDLVLGLDSFKNKPEKTISFHRDIKPIDEVTSPDSDVTTDSFSEVTNEITTISHIETTSESNAKIIRPRLKNKYESNRPRFSVKDYKSRLSSTTSTTEKSSTEAALKFRFPQRKTLYDKLNNDVETTTERKKFMPKDPRHKFANTDNETSDKERETVRPIRQRHTTTENTEGTTPKISSRIRNTQRRTKPTTEETTEALTSTTIISKRPLRKKIKDSDIQESVQDVSVTESSNTLVKTSENPHSESAIMKIADKKHQDHVEHVFEHSKRVSDLTLAASKDYNTPGMFKTVSSNSRRVPNYFTIATDDPILPIEAFFPQLNQKKES